MNALVDALREVGVRTSTCRRRRRRCGGRSRRRAETEPFPLEGEGARAIVPAFPGEVFALACQSFWPLHRSDAPAFFPSASSLSAAPP